MKQSLLYQVDFFNNIIMDNMNNSVTQTKKKSKGFMTFYLVLYRYLLFSLEKYEIFVCLTTSF